MSDLVELEEPKDTGHAMREEIRRTSDRFRARRVAISRVMVALCSGALAHRGGAARAVDVPAL